MQLDHDRATGTLAFRHTLGSRAILSVGTRAACGSVALSVEYRSSTGREAAPGQGL